MATPNNKGSQLFQLAALASVALFSQYQMRRRPAPITCL